jgi:hypothetical protein
MKTKITLILLFITLAISAQSFKTAIDYLEFIQKREKVIVKSNWKYTKAVAHSKNTKNIRQKRNVLIRSVIKAILSIERAKGFEGDDYKNQVLKNLRFNKSVLEDDYSKIIDMKEVAEQSYDLMEAYFLTRELAEKKMAEMQVISETNFNKFCEKHNIQVVKSYSDLSKKMKISNEVFKHYNKMYLIFFKVQINEIYLMKALNDKNVGTIQQNANALIEFAKEGLEALKTVEVYKNDTSLVEATKKSFEFYFDEAKNQIPKLTNFLILNEDFEVIKKTIDKTPQNKRTKKQVDAYNAKVKEINKAVKLSNKTNAELNTKRNNITNLVNTTNENFLSKHIPND